MQARDGTAVLWLVKKTDDVIGGLPDWSANDGPEAGGPAKHRVAHHFVVAAQHITEILKQRQKNPPNNKYYTNIGLLNEKLFS